MDVYTEADVTELLEPVIETLSSNSKDKHHSTASHSKTFLPPSASLVYLGPLGTGGAGNERCLWSRRGHPPLTHLPHLTPIACSSFMMDDLEPLWASRSPTSRTNTRM